MKKTVFLFSVIGFVSFFGCSKKKLDYSEKTIDSIPIYLVIANEGSEPYQKRLECNKKAFDFFINQENDSVNRINLFKIANRYYNMDDFREFKKTVHIILKRATDSKDTLSMAKAYTYIGEYFANTIKKDSAYLYYVKAEKIYQKRNDKINLGGVYISMATTQAYENDYLGCELSAVKALNVLRDTPDKSKIYEAHNILGFVANQLKDYEKSLEYHTKALAIAKENNLTLLNEVSSSLNNIGNVYQNQKKYKQAIAFFEEALKDKRLVFDKPSLYGIILDNLACSKFQIKDYSQLPDMLYKSLRIRDSLNIGVGVIFSKIHLSEYYYKEGDSILARKFAVEALSRSKEIKNSESALVSLRQLAAVDPIKASMYKEEYIKISDSLKLEERKTREKFARIRYETDEVILAKDKAVLQKWTVFWIAVSVLLSVLVFYLLRLRKSRQRELLLLLSRQKADEEIYHLISDRHQKFEEGREKEKKRIARELHDGVLGRLSNIRTSLLVLENKTDSETVRRCISQMAEIQDVEKEIRNIAHGLGRDLFFFKRDYSELLTSVLEDLANKTSLKINLEMDKSIDWNALDSQKKLGIYQILQEYFNCMDKQEIGTDMTVCFYKNNSLLIMEIEGVLSDIKNHEIEQVLKDMGLKEINIDLRISHILDGKTSLRMTMLMKTDQNI
ncbi:tetratricopeptide repeat-containing sensor histidine kinase [Flavobacterium microcysteis]|uniref:Tetratricopeptide repeat protein n=1 Tax=Flavobacterium microcysteis TaxID=2596891 RepID=A0A501PYI0_9FLAO|nr:tetratricopeptide repeat protein [Flavobacterium microcysteis]TPD65295.1 tetratricopeptide repeat protein [Flavobacterium microcysteis]